MGVFPFFMDIENKNFLIIGGGKVAARKVSRLLAFTGRITVAAPDTKAVEQVLAEAAALNDGTDAMQIRCNAKRVCLRGGAFGKEMLEEADYCIAATDDRALNELIARECAERSIPVNVVNAPHLSTWEFPALVKRGDLTVAVSTSGSSPAYAKMLRTQIEEMIPAGICGILERMTRIREQLPERVSDQRDREKIYRSILASLLAADNELSDEQLAQMVDEEIQRFTE